MMRTDRTADLPADIGPFLQDVVNGGDLDVVEIEEGAGVEP